MTEKLPDYYPSADIEVGELAVLSYGGEQYARRHGIDTEWRPRAEVDIEYAAILARQAACSHTWERRPLSDYARCSRCGDIREDIP